MGGNLNAEKQKLEWEKTKYFGDKVSQVVLSPVALLIGGFVLTNVLQHKVYGYYREDKPGFIEWLGGVREGSTTAMTYLTEDQANMLRTGLVAMVAMDTGFMDKLKGLFK